MIRIDDVFTDLFYFSKVTCDAPRHCCQNQERLCKGMCIPEFWINDGTKDCEDGSDERGIWKFEL